MIGPDILHLSGCRVGQDWLLTLFMVKGYYARLACLEWQASTATQ